MKGWFLVNRSLNHGCLRGSQFFKLADHDLLRFRFQGNIEKLVKMYESCSIMYQMTGNFGKIVSKGILFQNELSVKRTNFLEGCINFCPYLQCSSILKDYVAKQEILRDHDVTIIKVQLTSLVAERHVRTWRHRASDVMHDVIVTLGRSDRHRSQEFWILNFENRTIIKGDMAKNVNQARLWILRPFWVSKYQCPYQMLTPQ